MTYEQEENGTGDLTGYSKIMIDNNSKPKRLEINVDGRLKEYIKQWNPNKFQGFDSFREYIITFIAQELENQRIEIWKWCEDNRFKINESGFGKMDVVDCDGLGELLNKLSN